VEGGGGVFVSVFNSHNRGAGEGSIDRKEGNTRTTFDQTKGLNNLGLTLASDYEGYGHVTGLANI